MAAFDTTPQYAKAMAALSSLKGALGVTPDLQAIAICLISAADAEMPVGRYPHSYVGDPTDPRDRAVVEAHREYWNRFVEGDEVEESWHEL